MGKTHVEAFASGLPMFERQLALMLYGKLRKFRELRRKTLLWKTLALEIVFFSSLALLRLAVFESRELQIAIIAANVVALISCLMSVVARRALVRLKADLQQVYAGYSQLVPPTLLDQELAGGRYGTRMFWGAVAGLSYNDRSVPDSQMVQKLISRAA